jgi:hypothetical protein
MSNEISFSGRLSISKGNLQHVFAPSTLLADLASDTGAGGQQAIGGSAEQLELNADVTPYGMAYFRNLSTAIPVEIGATAYSATAATTPTSLVSIVRLLPGEYAISRVSLTSLFAKAVTAGTNTSAVLQFQVFSP